VLVTFAMLAGAPVWASAPAARADVDHDRPALVLFITVDQLRGDILPRYADRFAQGGFRRLLDRGVHYTNAHFQHAATYTATGHATIFTGGNAPEHGIVGNRWRDRGTGELVYSAEDDRHVLLGEPTGEHEGSSPRLLIGSTIGDELIVASGGRSRVYSVSLKDRSAIPSGGHLGKAYWYSKTTGRFVTSTYYETAYPAWVQAWHDADPADHYRERSWSLLHDRATYAHADDDDRGCENAYGSLGRTFPHVLRDDASASFRSALRCTPFGDELTLDFVLALLENERLGQGEATDMLAVGLSCTDYIGHAFGPHSLEAEDNLLRLDLVIARLLERIDETVGLERTLVVLASDHGMDASPEHRQALAERLVPGAGGPSEIAQRGNLIAALAGSTTTTTTIAGRVYLEQLIERADAAVRDRFGVDEDLVTAFNSPAVYLDEARIESYGLDMAEVEAAVAAALLELPGIAATATRTDLLTGSVPDTDVMRRVRRAFHPQRSGHVTVIQSPFWSLHYKTDTDTATHGSPYPYDTHVPIVIAAPGLGPATIARRVGPEDIAATLALYLNVTAPSGSTGEPLAEALLQE
jgi:predicted AlkP superfamily pyrophosphatase or phosphodiesterase